MPDGRSTERISRAVLGLNGGPTDDLVIALGCDLAHSHKTELVAIHVMEVDWRHHLDDDLAEHREQASRVLDLAEGVAERSKVSMDAQLLQARDVAAALVDEAVALDADAIILGLPYRRRFGGDFAMGRTIPYVFKNAPCRVLVVRERVTQGEIRIHPWEGTRKAMRTIIVGSGRVGAGLAANLARGGHEVIILDVNTQAFRRLEPGFPGQAIRGDGTDESVLRRVGAEGADWFFSVTNGDNRNVLAAQLAAETFGIPRVIAKINDPVRADAYAALGIDTINRTDWMIDAIERYMGKPGDPRVRDVNVAIQPEHRGPDHVPVGAEAKDSVAADSVAADAPTGGQ